MNPNDTKISRRLQTIMRKVHVLVEKECQESMGVTLILHPVTYDNARAGQRGEEREFQYISTLPREHMLGAMDAVVTQWKAKGFIGVPPHERN